MKLLVQVVESLKICIFCPRIILLSELISKLNPLNLLRKVSC